MYISTIYLLFCQLYAILFLGDKNEKLSELFDIDSDVEIKRIAINSKQVEPGDLFVCTMGVKADRHDL